MTFNRVFILGMLYLQFTNVLNFSISQIQYFVCIRFETKVLVLLVLQLQPTQPSRSVLDSCLSLPHGNCKCLFQFASLVVLSFSTQSSQMSAPRVVQVLVGHADKCIQRLPWAVLVAPLVRWFAGSLVNEPVFRQSSLAVCAHTLCTGRPSRTKCNTCSCMCTRVLQCIKELESI